MNWRPRLKRAIGLTATALGLALAAPGAAQEQARASPAAQPAQSFPAQVAEFVTKSGVHCVYRPSLGLSCNWLGYERAQARKRLKAEAAHYRKHPRVPAGCG